MKKTFVVAATIFAVLATMGTQGLCQEEGIKACYKKMNGQLRLVNDPARCRPSESSTSLVSREEFEALLARVENLEVRVEDLEEGGTGLPCQEEGCCDSPENCPKQGPVCSWQSTCQGTRLDATCIDNTCGLMAVDDDSACNTTVEPCSPYKVNFTCTGAIDQTPPSCPTFCETDDECIDEASCIAGNCEI